MSHTFHTTQSFLDSEFVQSLVQAITGHHLHELPEQNRHQTALDCVAFFVDFIVDFFEKQFEVKDAIRIKTVYESGHDLFETFPDLKHKYEQAYQAFLHLLDSENTVAA